MAPKEIYVVVKLVPKPGKFNEVAEAFKTFSKWVHDNEPKTQIYFALQPQGTEEFVFVEKYADSQSQKDHAGTASFKTFFKSIGGLLAAKPEIKPSSFIAGFEGRAKL
ncbi:hypothetical protein BDV18DRAFT_80170 [Aspergillus unguis]